MNNSNKDLTSRVKYIRYINYKVVKNKIQQKFNERDNVKEESEKIEETKMDEEDMFY